MRIKVVIGIVILLGGLATLMVWTSQQGGQPHYQLAEFKKRVNENPSSIKGVYMTIYGNVKEGSIIKKGIKADFVIFDQGHEQVIHFTGKTLLPDTFKDGAQASVDGVYDFEKKVFIADKVLAKCASKYEGKMNEGNYNKSYNKEGKGKY